MSERNTHHLADERDEVDFRQFKELQDEYSIEEEEEIDDGTTIMSSPFDPKDIDIKTKTMSLDNLIKRLREDEIDLAPDFQRKSNLWGAVKQSRLIESLLIKFPLPAFYFDGSDDNKWLVVDGLQRLSSIKNYAVDNKMELTGLEFLTKLNGTKFLDLPRTYQRQIEEAEIIAYIINPGTPDDVKFNIFKRINTGGLVLTPQEIRHALYQGIPSQFIAQLANVELFKQAIGGRISTNTRMLDREFVTRFISFYLNSPNDYKPDLDTFMTSAMVQLKETTQEERNKAIHDFTEAMSLSMTIFGRCVFRKVYNPTERRNPINKALFEVWSTNLALLSDEERTIIRKNKERVFEQFIVLMNDDEDFVSSITSSTGDRTRVIYRFLKIKTIIENILQP